MAKASELSDQELIEMITKHEKILKKLYKERSSRKLSGEEMSFQEEASVSNSGPSSEFAFDLKKEGIVQDNILASKDGKKRKEDMSSAYRITQLLTLDGKQLEELNKEQEKIRKEEEKIRLEKEKEKDKPKGRFG